MNSADCQKFEPQLPDYRWMSAAERHALDHHLVACPHCRAALRELQAVGDLFVQTRTTTPAGFAENVMAAVAREPQRATVPARAIFLLLGALAAEILLAALLRVGPGPWWQAATTFGSEFFQRWCAPVLANWSELLGALAGAVPATRDFVSQLNLAVWAGVAVLVVSFSWITINQGRTENG